MTLQPFYFIFYYFFLSPLMPLFSILIFYSPFLSSSSDTQPSLSPPLPLHLLFSQPSLTSSDQHCCPLSFLFSLLSLFIFSSFLKSARLLLIFLFKYLALAFLSPHLPLYPLLFSQPFLSSSNRHCISPLQQYQKFFGCLGQIDNNGLQGFFFFFW